MARQKYNLTGDSSEGHPDKICDRNREQIVDLLFREGAADGPDGGFSWQKPDRVGDLNALA